MDRDGAKSEVLHRPFPKTVIRLSPPGTDEGRPQIIFCPDVGGNVIYARPLVQALAGEAECYGLRLSTPMLSNLEDLTLIEIAKAFAADVRAADLPGPVYLVGFSFAAYMAAETARWMAALGSGPDQVWVLDIAARRRIDAKELLRFARDWMGSRIGRGPPPSHVLHRPGFLRIDLSQHPEEYRRILRCLYRRYADYRPDMIPGPVTVVVAEAADWHGFEADLGWSRCVTGEVRHVSVPGDHLGMLRNPAHAQVVADRMRAQFAIERDAPYVVADATPECGAGPG